MAALRPEGVRRKRETQVQEAFRARLRFGKGVGNRDDLGLAGGRIERQCPLLQNLAVANEAPRAAEMAQDEDIEAIRNLDLAREQVVGLDLNRLNDLFNSIRPG